MNPFFPPSPDLRSLIKTYKPSSPIRPVVNWENASRYKLTSTILSRYVQFHNAFSVKNTV